MVATPPPSLNICICDFITSFVFRTGIHASELASGEVIVRGRGAGGGGNNAGGRSLPPTGNYWSLGLSRFLGHFSRISRIPSGELSLADPPRRKCIETEVKRELGRIFRTGIGTFSTTHSLVTRNGRESRTRLTALYVTTAESQCQRVDFWARLGNLRAWLLWLC